MNRSPLNAIAINGNVHVRGESEASIVLESGLTLTYRVRMDSSTAEIVVQGEGDVTRRAMGNGLASIEAQSEIDPVVVAATTAEAEADIAFETGTEPYLILRPDGRFDIVTQAEIDPRVTPGRTGEGVAPIVFQSTLEPEIRPAPWGDGEANIRMEADLQPSILKARHLDGTATILVSSWGSANLTAQLGGEAAIELRSQLDPRLGDKIQLDGTATIELLAWGQSNKWHQVHLEGVAEIQIQMETARFGLPAIPTVYEAARPDWQLRVPADEWRFVVPKDSWGQR